jgi:FkbM family methyltransferase
MGTNMIKKRFISFLYNLLVSAYNYRNNMIWRYLWRKVIEKNNKVPIRSRIHQYSVIMNCGYTYPLYSRIFPNFNNPLLELVFQSSISLNRKITIIDVGAAIGDTMLMLERNLPGIIEQYVAIDGDEEFFFYLEKNLSSIGKGYFLNAILSDDVENIKNLVRTHSGTASSQGKETVKTTTLALEVNKLNLSYLDIIKVDVDGFDGRVLGGSVDILNKYQPGVIFEWHPILYKETGNDYQSPFNILSDIQYKRYYWFTKYGEFSHFTYMPNDLTIEKLAQICLNGKHDYDWHYDIIALPESSKIHDISLMEMQFAKNKPSRY